ncbi:MAG: 2-oxo acid dehydrogenase subunit E2 [Thermoguttaceae bacterium]|jgi:pyruvate dehydrogenase E2 component (dihydrolipoamide acetyltransferase)
MRFEMKMPDLATTESEIRIVRWLVQPGQKVDRGRPLVEVETDKATMEVESVASGVLTEVRAQVDDEVLVGQVIGVLEVEGPPPEAACVEPSSDSAAVASAAVLPTAVAATALPAPVAGRACGMFARNRTAAATPAAPGAGVALSVAQRTAARRLQESKQTVPHFYLQTSANASAMVARRQAAEPVKPAWDAFFVLAVARAIGRFDRFQCRFDSERLAPAGCDAIGVAIDLDGELYVVPVASPATKTVENISDEIRRGVEWLQSGDPEARRIRPALMTVTNLGVCNVESFIPIINPPEAAILGVGRVMPTPVARDDGRVAVEHRVTLTLSADHRIVSGKYAGSFLGAIIKELESM